MIVWAIIFLVIVGFLFYGSLKNPTTAVAGTLLLFGLEQWGQAKIPILAVNSSFTNYIIGSIVAAALVVQFLKRKIKIGDYPGAGYLVAFLFLYAYASSIWAPNVEVSAAQWRKAWPYIITFVIFAPLLISDTQEIEKMLETFIVLGFILTVLLLFTVTWENRGVLIEYGSSKSMGNPLATAQMAGHIIIATILGSSLSLIKPWRILRWVGVVACIALAVKAGSRGQVISLIFILSFFWAINQKKFSVWTIFTTLAGCTLIGLVIGIFIQEFWGSGNIRWSQEQMTKDVSGRFDMAFRLLSVWWKGDFLTIIFGLGNSASFDHRIIGFYPHVVPLEILGEEGLLGFLFYILIIGLVVHNFFKSYRSTHDLQNYRKIIVTLAAMFVYSFLLTLKQGNFLGNTDMWMLCIFLLRFGVIVKNKNKMQIVTNSG